MTGGYGKVQWLDDDKQGHSLVGVTFVGIP